MKEIAIQFVKNSELNFTFFSFNLFFSIGPSTFFIAYTVARQVNNFHPQCLKLVTGYAVLSSLREHDVKKKVQNPAITKFELVR